MFTLLTHKKGKQMDMVETAKERLTLLKREGER